MDAVNKALEILDVFFEAEGGLTVGEIARSAKISSSSSHRITSILVDRGYLEQESKRGKYFLSKQKLVYLASVIRKRLRVRSVALPYIQDLAQAVDEAVLISLRRGQIVYNLEVVNSSRLLTITPDSTTFDLYSTGVGKVFLAYMSEKTVDDYLSSIIFKPRTPNTITDAEELKRHLSKIRREGVAFDDEEQEVGVRMVSAPVMDWDGNVTAAIGAVGPSSRMTRQKMVEIAPQVKNCAQQISQALGYSPSEPGLKVNSR